MSHKEKLWKLHSRAMVKTLVLMEYEKKYISEEGLCGVACDPINYETRMELYVKMQDAVNKRDELAKLVNEKKIHIDSPFVES